MGRRGLTRRELLASAGAGAGLLAASQVSRLFSETYAAPAPLEKDLVVTNSGGAFDRALRQHFFDPFTRATGVNVLSVSATAGQRWARIRAMVESGNVEWDINIAVEASIMANQAYVEKLDCRRIPNAALHGVEGSCQEWGLLLEISPTMIAYNTNVYPPGRRPQNWADFWDVRRFPGPRGFPNYGSPWEELAVALMADGVPPNKLFPMDVDRAFRKMDQLKPHVAVWWRTGDQSQQIMRDLEVLMNMMWSGRALTSKKQGLPIDVEWNQAINEPDYWVVYKNAPHPNAAHAFLNFFMDRPEAHLAFSNEIGYDTSNRKALGLVPEAERSKRALAHLGKMARIDSSWVAKNRDVLVERWNKWLAQ